LHEQFSRSLFVPLWRAGPHFSIPVLRFKSSGSLAMFPAIRRASNLIKINAAPVRQA